MDFNGQGIFKSFQYEKLMSIEFEEITFNSNFIQQMMKMIKSLNSKMQSTLTSIMQCNLEFSYALMNYKFIVKTQKS